MLYIRFSHQLISSGSALYIFGPNGPSFGVFQVEIDNSVIGTYNASTTVDLYNTLLFFVTHLSSTSQHDVMLTNQDEGMFLALDYCVSVQAGGSPVSAAGADQPGTAVSAPTGTGSTPSVTSGFPNSPNDSNNGSASSQNPNGSAGAVIGGILGALAGLVSR